ncbi:MAG: hypothetical protein QME82_00375 [Bacillota bacterium]|nr:hypothetical protein [Bacillota bacterium]
MRLGRLPEPGSAEVVVKLVSVNRGGSMKARPALRIIEEAEKAGLLRPGCIIVGPPAATRA